jgi:transposase
VQRARIIALMLEDRTLYASKAALKAGFSSATVGALWVKRFNEQGLAGLQDKARPGRQPVHTPETRSALVSLATQKPATLGYPFQLWTLERLQRAFGERHGTHLSDSTIWEWLAAEGLEWKRQQSWFHDAEKHDPEFVEKRGASLPPI